MIKKVLISRQLSESQAESRLNLAHLQSYTKISYYLKRINKLRVAIIFNSNNGKQETIKYSLEND